MHEAVASNRRSRAGSTGHHDPLAGHAEPLDPTAVGSPRRFVVTLLATALGIIFTVFLVNVLVDPYGTVGTNLVASGLPRDPSTKAALIKQLGSAPQLVVLGSSRSLKVQPSYLHRLTGESVFNAGLRDATPVEEYALVHFIHDRFPGAHVHWLWLLDVEAFRGGTISPALLDSSDLAPYVSRTDRLTSRLHGIADLLSWRALEDSFSSLRATHHASPPLTLDGRRLTPRRIRHLIRRSEGFAPDGFYTRVDYNWSRSTQKYQAMYGDGSLYTHLQALPKTYLERTLRDMNSWGEAPVIVLTPMHPNLIRQLAPVGWSGRHKDLVSYLERLRSTYRFRFLDFSSIRSFGGERHGFYDPVHMREANLHRMLSAILGRASGAL
jgi:hypothetical protein